ncbi:MAG TPA: molybdopterin-synthase adenylyltransferase MoeB [Cyclobacteriaceae bacterium]|nr:molybdopterin-synthase adenylyltransferase MoeB [Cyclobacteriaceae bacterium]
MLNPEDIHRYSRQLLLPDFGTSGQEKLRAAAVLVIGAGGLGSPVLQYLAAAGVGRLGVVDHDVVDASNLQRQVLFTTPEIGESKAIAAARRLRLLNPLVDVREFPIRLTSHNALELFVQFDLIVDGSDNLPTRYLVNDACVLTGKPLIYGAVFQFEGQVSVFNQLLSDGSRGPNYRDLFPDPPPPEMVPSCSEGGVMGALTGVIGSMQANEAIKVISGVGESLSGRLMIFDAASFIPRILKVRKRDDNPLTGIKPTQTSLIDYESFCHMIPTGKDEITPAEVKQWIEQGTPFQWIDVRELFEFEAGHLPTEHIPLSELPAQAERLARSMPVIVHCKSGSRGAQACKYLRKAGFNNVRNMQGGILRWQQEIDPGVVVY